VETDTEQDIELREVYRFDEPEFSHLVQTHLIGDLPVIPESTWLSESEVHASNELKRALGKVFALRIGAYQGDRLVGWSHGFQDGSDSFLMATSAVLPAYRRRGLYTKLVRAVLERTRAAGFQMIHSKHGMTNNPVLIAKLKLGFTISGLEMSDVHGALVRLRYLFNERRAAIAEMRVGAKRLDREIAALLGVEHDEK
jgi:GNAT superfamily N-acetyltransferase